MRTTCPNCGAPIEFRYDDSFVRVCASCNHAVLRTDRAVESLGKVADLAPLDSALKLFAEGHVGTTSFLLVGMAQIRHEAGGLWQEWYAKLDGGKWGWLAEAQGRLYLTFEEPWLAAPSDLAVGEKVDIPVHGATKAMTVAEVNTASFVGARGELPFKLVPNETFRYADLSDGEGTFATIDFGGDGEPPRLYVGTQVALDDLHMTGGEEGPSHDPEIKSRRLACPECNAPIALRVPGEALRAVCSHCNTLLDTSGGELAILGKLKDKAAPKIPLGTKGTFSEGELMVIGYVERSALVEGEWWAFDEYLLHREGLGYRWLVQSDGHWSYVQPIVTGAVDITTKGVSYDGVRFARYQTADLRVDRVLGEFFWKVQVGEQVSSEDFIAPPAMVSHEYSSTETTWSLGTYLTEREVQHAFGDQDLALGTPTGIAPNQPDAWSIAASVMSLAFMALLVLGMVFSMAAKNDQKFFQIVELGGGGSGAPAPKIGDLVTMPSIGGTMSDPTVVADCAEYKALYDLVMACDAAPREERDTYKAVFEATFVSSDADVLALSCKGAITTTHTEFDDACKLPTHEQYLARTAPNSDRAADAGSGSGSGSGSDSEVTTAPADSIFFSEPIQIDGGRNIEIAFDAPTLTNDWVYLAADLVESSTGAVASAEASMDYYMGIDDGESWAEGNHRSSTVFGPQPAGTYILRLEAQHGSSGLMPINVTIKQGVFRGKWLACAMLLLGLPLSLIGLVSYFHEKNRWSNSNAGKAPITPVAILVLTFVGVFLAIGWLLKALAEANSDD